MDMRELLERIGSATRRPRYAFLVLNLIAQGADADGECGPFLQHDGETVPVRTWLVEMMHPITRHTARRTTAIIKPPAVFQPASPDAEQPVSHQAGHNRQRSGLTNVSTAVSDLVRAGLVTRYYAGYRVDHVHRGGQRHVVYNVAAEIRAALAGFNPQSRFAA